jgi:GNAT superfamily N-acetyltransferase
MPKTKAGQDLERRGLKFETDIGGNPRDRGGYFSIKDQNGDEIATMAFGIESMRQTPDSPKETTGYVYTVDVDPSFQKQGIAEAMYRELANYLQGLGITKLQGDVVHPAPLSIREKLFPETRSRTEKDYTQGIGLRLGILNQIYRPMSNTCQALILMLSLKLRGSDQKMER